MVSKLKSKLGRVLGLNCCSSELHKQPGERDSPVPAKARELDQAYYRPDPGGFVGGRDHSALD